MRQVRHGSTSTTEAVRPEWTARIAPRLASILALVIGSPTISRASDDPYIPPGGAPDYVVTFAVTAGGGARKPKPRTVSHHGARTRIDDSNELPAHVVYLDRDRRISIHAWPAGADHIGQFVAEWGEREDEDHWQTDERRTTERRMVASEACTVWLVRHALKQKLERKSCMTEDGIEVASSVETGSGTILATEAVRVERRELRLDDVSPPQHLFDPAFWLKKADIQGSLGSLAGTSADPSPNDEATLMRSDEASRHASSSAAEIHRRYGTAASVTTFKSDGGWRRELAFGNRLSFVFESSATGTYRRLGIGKRMGDRTQSERREKLDRAPDLILSESCTWYDDAPGLQDASFFHCETSDGIVLKNVHLSRHLREMLTAKALRRGTNQLADFLPPSDLSDERQWRRPGDQIPK